MSSSASEEKARQRRLRNVTRQVIQKAYLQRIKDELIAEERRKVREERQRRGKTKRRRAKSKERGKRQDKEKLLSCVHSSCLLCYSFLLCVLSTLTRQRCKDGEEGRRRMD